MFQTLKDFLLIKSPIIRENYLLAFSHCSEKSLDIMPLLGREFSGDEGDGWRQTLFLHENEGKRDKDCVEKCSHYTFRRWPLAQSVEGPIDFSINETTTCSSSSSRVRKDGEIGNSKNLSNGAASSLIEGGFTPSNKLKENTQCDK